ncbi:uncharacterized protein LOC125263536 [Megalobrama amblycephala]|uniref:uncharacterized protein LOC125263536 n=1 Tax=Megalobrama amblycephala TaxID=75352 RepID=UPI0020140133|nr:uncharacterized protein LOC125263536 [Megalobrama amblycephala]
MYGVYGADVGTVKPVSVMKGDSVTLHTGVTELQRDDKIEWMNENRDIIAQIENNITLIHEDRLELDHKTGSLTIRKIAENRLYELHIRGDQLTSKTFNVTVHGGVKTVSVKEGDPVNLHTDVIAIKGFDVILWKTEGDLVAEINQVTNRFSLYDSGDVRFKGRLDLDRQSGDLTISDAETTDSGVYHLHMSSSTHTLQRNISVTVKNSGNSGAVSGISGASVALVVWAVTVFLLQEV